MPLRPHADRGAKRPLALHDEPLLDDPAAERRRVRTHLAEQIRRIEGHGASGPASAPATGEQVEPIGLAEIDARLGGGLASGAVHEFTGPVGQAAALGFAAVVLGRFARRGPVVWITPRRPALYMPGLAGLGLSPERLLIIEAPSRGARLWALAEALRMPGLVAALAEAEAVDFTLSRRLQLAAGRSGAGALLLDQGPPREQPSAARTRWRITAMRSRPGGALARLPRTGLGPPRWRLELLRGPAAATGRWIVECTTEGLRHVDVAPHDDRDVGSRREPLATALPVALAAASADRPTAPPQAPEERSARGRVA